MISDNVNLIVYHGDCPDGWCAAFVAKQCYPEAELMPRHYGMELPDLIGKHVLVVDFSWRTREQNIEMSKQAASFHILDHHATAQDVLAGLDFATFDMNRSGAGITWDTLFPGETRPWYVNYVEDRDLWRWQLPHSKAISAYMMTQPMTMEGWEQFKHMAAFDAATLGEGALAHVRHYVEKATRQKRSAYINGYKAALVNTPYMNISEVCHELLEQDPEIEVAAGWFLRGDGMVQYSFRSRKDGPDVSVIAKNYGGGGHRNAAGAQDVLDVGIPQILTWMNSYVNNAQKSLV